jgi:hypothetical protein
MSGRVARAKAVTIGWREPGLDDVDAHVLELLCEAQLLVGVERKARRLLAIAQRGVEDEDPVVVVAAHYVRGQQSTTSFAGLP